MDFLSALKSGKRFRVAGGSCWYSSDAGVLMSDPYIEPHHPYALKFFLADFELEEEPKPKLKAWVNSKGGPLFYYLENAQPFANEQLIPFPQMDEK